MKRLLVNRLLVKGFLVLAACLAAFASTNARGEDSKTVLGPGNAMLADGAKALVAGDAETGVRLTLDGLKRPSSDRDRRAAWSNLCAGYIMLNQLDTALDWCNRAIAAEGNWRAYSNRALIHVQAGRFDQARADIDRAEELVTARPRKLRDVTAMLLDKTQPVRPRVSVDDRRQPPDGDDTDLEQP